MIFKIFYELGLIVLALVAMPMFLYRLIFEKKYRSNILHRLGFDFPKINKQNRPLIWIHAASIGETKAIATLAKKIKIEWDNPIILISSVTETGHAEALKSIPEADFHAYLPFDFGWIIRPIVKRIQPNLVILSESEFWFNFLDASKKNKAKVVLVNGKLSLRSLNRFSKFHWAVDPFFNSIDLFCVQGELYAERFRQLGIPQEKISVTGNLKFDEKDDSMPPEEREQWRNTLGIDSNRPILVLGSTHDPEEKLFLDQLEEVWKKFPSLAVIIVPRHKERFNEVASLLDAQKIPFAIFSLKTPCEGKKVLLMDAMGVLRKCYQIANIAFVGGTYTPKVGGHSIIEPARYGVPVIYGPYMYSQPDMIELVQRYKAGLQVPSEAVSATLIDLLSSPAKVSEMGASGLRMLADLQGITNKTEKCLKEITRT